MLKLSWKDVQKKVEGAIQTIDPDDMSHLEFVYGIPRGGIPVAQMVSSMLGLELIENVNEAPMSRFCSVLVVDDVVKTGATRRKFNNYPFICLYDKSKMVGSEWIEFPWERMKLEAPASDSVVRQLEYIGEDLDREGLKETPNRVVKAWDHLFSGYKKDPADVFKTFDPEGSNEMVIMKDIEMYSMCEHHLLPFIGKAHIAYIPNKKIIGASKLARLLEIYARRAQIQERIGKQVTAALDENLKPAGSACIIEASHLCMQSRGVEKQNSVMITSSLTGVFMTDPQARMELMSFIKGGR